MSSTISQNPRIDACIWFSIGPLIASGLFMIIGCLLWYFMIPSVDVGLFMRFIFPALFFVAGPLILYREYTVFSWKISLENDTIKIMGPKDQGKPFPLRDIKNIQWQRLLGNGYPRFFVITPKQPTTNKIVYLNATGPWSKKQIDTFVRSIRFRLRLPEKPARLSDEWFQKKFYSDKDFFDSLGNGRPKPEKKSWPFSF